MYKVIMVPTDGSGFDREAIRVALRVAEQTDAKVQLVRVLTTGSLFELAAGTEGIPVPAEVVLSERDKAMSELGYSPRGLERGLHDTLAAEGKLPAGAPA